MLPFEAGKEARTNKFLKNVTICKEALGALFRIGFIRPKALVKHATHQTLPVYEGNMLPVVACYFKDEILLLVDVGPI